MMIKINHPASLWPTAKYGWAINFARREFAVNIIELELHLGIILCLELVQG